jgi:hypothetical protein
VSAARGPERPHDDEHDEHAAPGDSPAGPDPSDDLLDPVLEVAADLLAQHGLIVTFLWLAKDTGVPAGDLSARFVTIDGLVGQVLDYLLKKLFALRESVGVGDGASIIGNHDGRRYWRVLTRAVLAGRDVASLQSSFPAIESQRAVLSADPLTTSDEAAGLAAAQATAYLVGWVLFEDFFLGAAGLRDVDRRAVRMDVFNTMGHLGRWRARLPFPLERYGHPDDDRAADGPTG